MLAATAGVAQDAAPDGAKVLRLATVTRPPFSMELDGVQTGFSIDLWNALASEMNATTEVVRVESFTEMLDLVRRGEVDAAAANISITAGRESEMDFSQPIFESGLRILIPAEKGSGASLLSAILSRDLLLAIGGACGLLLLAGMLMWLFERRQQAYFDHPPHKALFPAFWWALNLVVNGGFEERQPQSVLGRVLATFLVVSSLFLVSVFVAQITATMTVSAIQSSVSSVNDLYGRRIGTTSGSTAAAFLDRRDFDYRGYADFSSLIASFERSDLDAVVFDAPILAYYTHMQGQGRAQLAGSVFLRENYGIALPTGSSLAEAINQDLLKLRENGTYEAIRMKWFGADNG
ncbi:MAG: transporter substrate-binding domain-containing protein [Maritimibacter sp.]